MVCTVALSSAMAEEEESSWYVQGYFKTFFTAFDPAGMSGADALPEEPMGGVSSNRLRLKFFWNPAEWFTFIAAYEMSPQLQFGGTMQLSALPAASPATYRVYDAREQLYPGPDGTTGTFSLHNNIDRLTLVFSAPFMDVSLGRQAIGFGSARVINPTDIFAPFSYQALDKEERYGIDAVRVTIPLGQMSELDMGYVFGKDASFSKSGAFLKGKMYFWDTDITLTSALFRDNLLLGVDIARAIGDAGFWLEAAYVFANLTDNYRPEDDYFRGSIGIDYNFADGVYVFAEYHFSSAGYTDPKDYLKAAGNVAYTEGGVQFLGQHYISLGMTHQTTPLITIGSQFVMNLLDPSVFWSANLAFSISDEATLEAGAFIAMGKEGRMQTLPNFAPQSEFGLYPNIYYTAMKVYF